MSALDDMIAQQQAQQAAQWRASQQPPAVRPFQEPLGQPAEQAQPAQAPEDTSLLGRVGATVRKVFSGSAGSQGSAADRQGDQDTAKALAGWEAGLVRAPGQLLGGALDTMADAGKFVGANMQSPFVRSGVASTMQMFPQAAAAVGAGALAKRLNGGASLADTLSARESLGKVGNPGVNQFAAQGGAIGLALPFGGDTGAAPEALPAIAKVAKGAGQLLMNSAKVGAATAVALDPRSARISDMIQQAGVHSAFIDYLASNPDDPDIEARLKNGIEGAIGNAAIEPLFMGGARLIKAAMGDDLDGVASAAKDLKAQAPAPTTVTEATPQEALRDNLDRAFATGRTQEARYQGADTNLAAQDAQAATESPTGAASPPKAEEEPPPAQEQIAQGTRHSDVAPPTPEVQSATDANALLEKAGSAERVAPDTMQVTPEGKVVVAPSTKAMADEAGVGRAFDTAEGLEKPDQVIFKEVDPEGGQRVVGMMGKEDLEGFLQDANHWQERPDESVQQINNQTAPETAGRVGQWSIGKLGAPYDVPAFMRALADRMQGVTRPLTDLELNTQAKAIADQTGLHPDDIFHLGQQVSGSTQDLAVGMQAVRTVQSRVMQDLMGLRGTDWASLEDGDPAIEDAIQKIHNATTFASYVEEAKTSVGQALRVNQLPDADAYMEAFKNGSKPGAAPQVPKPDEEIPIPRNREELGRWLDQLDAISTTGDPAAVQAFLKGKIAIPKWWDYLGSSFGNFFTGALVSAPRTLVRDLWGPAIISGFNTLGRTSAGAMMALNPLLDEATRREAWTASWGAARAYTTVLSDMADALRSAAKTTANGFSRGANSADPYWDPFGSNLGNSHAIIGGHNPIDLNSQGIPRVLLRAALGTDGAGTIKSLPYYAGNLINKFPQAVMALHGGFNDLAQTLAYLGEVRASAYNEGAKLGLQGDDFKQYLMDRLTQARDPTTGAGTDAQALAQSQRTVLTKQPTDADPAMLKAVFGFRQGLVKAFPPMRFILPIWTVPANALGETLRRIPGMGFALDESRAELMGEKGVAAQADAYGRMLTGGAALAAGVMLGQSGALTGAGPTQAQDRDIWLMTHQPYSIRIGDKWYSYARSDVVGPMLSIASAFYDKTVNNNGDLSQHAVAAAAGLAEYFKDQASLQGLAQILNFGGNPEESETIATRVLGQVTSGFVPGFLRQIRDQLDPVQREHHTVGDYVMDSIPGFSRRVDPVRNVLGEPVMKPQSPVFGTLPVSMANVNTYAKEPVMDELSRLYEKTGEAHGVLSPSLGPNAQKDMRDVKLEDGTSLYDALMRYRMVSRDDQGRTLKEALGDLITSPDYLNAVDGKSTALMTDDGTDIRGSMIRQVFSQFSTQARQDVAQASPKAARYLAAAQVKNRFPAQTNGHSVDDVATNPGLLGALGVNISDYEDKVKGQ